MKLNNERRIHWDSSKLLSYNCAMNFAISGLGSGKTTEAKKMVLNNYAKKGERFIWVLRRVKDVDNVFKLSFMNQFEEYGYFVKDGVLWSKPGSLRPDHIEGDDIVGYFYAMADANGFRRFQLENISWLIYDEFLINPYERYSKYLPGEMTNILVMWDKVARNYNFKTRVLFLGNPYELANPYFQKLGINPEEVRKNKNKIYKPHPDIAIDYFDTPSQVLKQREDNPIGRISRLDTDFHKMAYGSNEMYTKNLNISKTIPQGYRLNARLKIRNQPIYIYSDGNHYYATTFLSTAPKDSHYLAVDVDDWNGQDTTLIDRHNPIKLKIQVILSAIRQNRYSVESENTHSYIKDIIGMLK